MIDPQHVRLLATPPILRLSYAIGFDVLVQEVRREFQRL
jgi:hypothetical protein